MKKFKFVFIFLVLLVPLKSHALTLSEIQFEVRRYMDDNSDPKILYTDDYMLGIINETQREIVNTTWCLQTTYNQALSAGTTYYALPAAIIAVIQVDYVDATRNKIDLAEVSEKSLKQDNPDYERQSGKPTEYFVRYSTYSQTTLEMGFHPVPTTSSTGTAKIQYYNQATDLSAATDIPFDSYKILYPYHNALVWGTVYRMKMIEGKPDAPNYLTLYQQAILLMQDRTSKMPNYSPGFRGAPK